MASSALVSGALPVTTQSWKASSSSLKALAYEVISLMLRDLDGTGFALDDLDGGRCAAQERRREAQGDALLRAVERELHFVAGDARQVEPVDRHGQLAELEDDGQRTALHVDVFQARRLTEDAADGVDLMDQGVQQHQVVLLAQERVGLTDGAGDAGRRLGAEVGDRLVPGSARPAPASSGRYRERTATRTW